MLKILTYSLWTYAWMTTRWSISLLLCYQLLPQTIWCPTAVSKTTWSSKLSFFNSIIASCSCTLIDLPWEERFTSNLLVCLLLSTSIIQLFCHILQIWEERGDQSLGSLLIIHFKATCWSKLLGKCLKFVLKRRRDVPRGGCCGTSRQIVAVGSGLTVILNFGTILSLINWGCLLYSICRWLTSQLGCLALWVGTAAASISVAIPISVSMIPAPVSISIPPISVIVAFVLIFVASSVGAATWSRWRLTTLGVVGESHS